MASSSNFGYYRSDSVLRTDSVPYSSNIQEHEKQRRKAASKKPQGSPGKRPQSQVNPRKKSQSQESVSKRSQASPSRKSQSQVTVARKPLANSAKKSQVTSAKKSQVNPAKKSQVTLVQSRSGLQSTSHQSSSFDSGFTTTEERSHPKPKKGKGKTTVIKVKECPVTVDNTELESLPTPRLSSVAGRDGARTRSMSRSVVFKAEARDVSTPRTTRSNSTPPSSARKSGKAEKNDAHSRPSSGFSDITILSAPWSSEMDEAIEKVIRNKKPYRNRVPPAKKYRPRPESPETDSDAEICNYSDDFEPEETDSDDFGTSPYGDKHGMFSNYKRGPVYTLNEDMESTRILTPTQNVYEADFEATDSDSSYQERALPSKQKKKGRVIHVAEAAPCRRIVTADVMEESPAPFCSWRPKTAATYRVASNSDIDNEDKNKGPREGQPDKSGQDRGITDGGRSGTRLINVAPARPITAMTYIVGYDGDVEENEYGVNREKKKRYTDYGLGASQPAPQRNVETPDEDFYDYFKKDASRAMPQRKVETPDDNDDIVVGGQEPEEQRWVKTPTDEEFFDNQIVGGERPQPPQPLGLRSRSEPYYDGVFVKRPEEKTEEETLDVDDMDDDDEVYDDVEASSSDPRTPYGLPYETYSDDDLMEVASLTYDEPYRQKGLGEYLESRGDLDGLNKDDLKLDLGWVEAENPTPRAAPTFEVRGVAIGKPKIKATLGISKGLRADDNFYRNRYMYEKLPPIKFHKKKMAVLKEEVEEENMVDEKREKRKKREKKEQKRKEKKEEEKKEEKKEGRVRKFFRRLRDAVSCCVRRQDN